MERKCIKCIHFVCTREECSAENTEVCDLYETEVSRAIKKLREEGYEGFERSKVGGNNGRNMARYKTDMKAYIK